MAWWAAQAQEGGVQLDGRLPLSITVLDNLCKFLYFKPISFGPASFMLFKGL
jgi:hypothetical protein